MLVYVLKFVHLLLTLSLLGSTLFCVILASFNVHPERHTLIARFSRLMLWLLLFALLTGTLLVYPKHFTFHTPWIQAAYILVFLSGTLLSAIYFSRKKTLPRGVMYAGFFVLLTILIAVVHDAVTKTTFDSMQHVLSFLHLQQ